MRFRRCRRPGGIVTSDRREVEHVRAMVRGTLRSVALVGLWAATSAVLVVLVSSAAGVRL